MIEAGELRRASLELVVTLPAFEIIELAAALRPALGDAFIAIVLQ